MEIQTRSERTGIRIFHSLEEAISYANREDHVWKISFELPTRERVRMVRGEEGYWVYSPIPNQLDFGEYYGT